MLSRFEPAIPFTAFLKIVLRPLLLLATLLAVPAAAVAEANLQSLFNFQTKMAAQGNSEAMVRLGEMYEEGLGTEKSEERAQEWYQKARDKGNPDGQAHLDQLQQKRERAAQEQATREKAAREQAAREQAEREKMVREQAEREKAAREQAEREKLQAQQAAARRESTKKEMTPEERARAREEAIRRAEEVEKLSLQKQLEKERAESEALRRERDATPQ